MAVQQKTQLTAQIQAVDDFGEEHLVQEYTTFVPEQTPNHHWSMWATEGRTFVCDGHYLSRISATVFRVARNGQTLIAVDAACDAKQTRLH
jgi:hypothetical protein